MQVTLLRQPIEEVQTDTLLVIVLQDRREDRLGFGALWDAGEVTGKPFEMTLLHNVPGVKAQRVLAVGAGKPAKFTTAELRRAVGAAVRYLKSKSITEAAVWLDAPHADSDYVSAAVEGAILGDFETDRYKTEKKDIKRLNRFSVALAGGGPHLDAALERGRILAEAQNFSREMANDPPNRLTPLAMAEYARGMANEFGLECEVLDRDRMAQLGMGSLLGVAIGSAEPPALIILRYHPATAAGGSVHLGLVGKGVTFDTGGISIKPSDDWRHARHRTIETGDSGDCADPRRREHARQPRAASRRYCHFPQRKNHRGDQYRRRRAPDSGGRHHLRPEAGLHPFSGRRHADRCRRSGLGAL
jgi:leucyl aminopeptidase